MANLKLLKEVKYLPKLSLDSDALEYFEWEESLDDFYYRYWLLDIYYAEETLAKDLLSWWIDDEKRNLSATWSDMKAVIQDLFLGPIAVRKMIAEAYGSTSRTTKPIDSSKHQKKADSQLLPKVAVPKPPIVHADFSLASGLHSSASPCDTKSEITMDDTNDISDGLSMMAQDVHSDGTAIMVKGQRSNIFHSECKINDKVCKLVIDGGSSSNAISSDLVHALSLSTR